jgi:hypothetical protein
VLVQKHDNKISEESSGRPKLFADTDCTAKSFNETSGRLNIRRVAEIYAFSPSELARMISVEVKDFRRWLNASNAELNYRSPLQMIRAGQIHELAGIVCSALLGQPVSHCT